MQRALNALRRGSTSARLEVDGLLGRKTAAAFAAFLADGEREGEAALVRAMRALG